MKEITTNVQMGLFHAAGIVFAAVQRLNPPAPGELAAAGLLTMAVAPTFEEFRDHMIAQGRPTPDPREFAEMTAAARRFAASVLVDPRETQH